MVSYPYIIVGNRIFYVDASGNLWEWIPDSTSGGLGSLGGFWSFLGKIGAVASYAIPGVGPIVGPLATTAVGALDQNAAKGKQEKEIGAQWEQLAGQVVALFNQIQAKAIITAADAEQAAAALTQLGQAASQYGSIEYITRQWNSAAYKPAFEQRLQQIIEAAQRSTPASSTQSAGGGIVDSFTQGSGGGVLSSPLVLAAAILGGVLLLRG